MQHNQKQQGPGADSSRSGGRYSEGEDDDYSSSAESENDSGSDISTENDDERDTIHGKSGAAAISHNNANNKAKSSKGNESAEDYSDDEDEGEDGYKVGGYHRVKIGEVYNQR